MQHTGRTIDELTTAVNKTMPHNPEPEREPWPTELLQATDDRCRAIIAKVRERGGIVEEPPAGVKLCPGTVIGFHFPNHPELKRRGVARNRSWGLSARLRVSDGAPT